MANLATPNLPARDLAVTSAFYADLGFSESYRDNGWMILTGHDLTLEFFAFLGLDPATSSFGSCLRLDDLDAFVARCQQASIPVSTTGWPRLQLPQVEPSGLRIGALIDPDCSLLRLIQNG